MEKKDKKYWILKTLQLLAWIIFIGLCVDAGALLVNSIITLFINPSGVKNFWEGATYLSALHEFDRLHFSIVALVLTGIAVTKAIMFYFIIELFVEKHLNMTQPFTTYLLRFMLKLSCFTLCIGLLCYFGFQYCIWLSTQGLVVPDVLSLHLEGADVWLFMASVLFVIVQIIKRGLEIQNENDLTI